VQSLDDRSLATLERVHSAQKAKEAILSAQKAGFDNISIDLMYDLPDQSLASFRYTLDQLKDLPIQHLSLYNLTIEPHTSFYKRRKTLNLPDSDTSFLFLQMALETLEKIGLKRYEISAFAKEGFASRHNLGYWTARPFLGFGPSAFSYWKGERYKNVANLNRYAKALQEGLSPIDFRENLPYPQNIHELLAVQLRLSKGVDLTEFKNIPPDTLTAIERLINEGWLRREKTTIRLTEKGTLFYDTVASEII
jgi:oxygen-independent coproporphyrinogen-3 oxidase